MSLSLSKKDVCWSYGAQFFKLASGVLILPMVLSMLSIEEIALNYLLMALGGLAALFDFGFSPQFGRNISYAFSGAQSIEKEGVSRADRSQPINYALLVNMIGTARFVYLRISLLVTAFLLTFGTWYIYTVTDGFRSVDHAVLIWAITVLASFLNFYFAYLDSLLVGRGKIGEANRSVIASKVVYLLTAATALWLGAGLLGVAVSGLISALVYRLISYRYFYDASLQQKLAGIAVDLRQRRELFTNIWFNSRKLGMVLLSGYAINHLSMFLAGLYLDAGEIASYGVLRQLVGIIGPVASTLFISYNPTFSSLRVTGDKNRLIRVFAFSMNVYYILFFLGGLFLVMAGPSVLAWIGSRALLPSATVMILYASVVLLEGNHSNFATLIATDNKVPFFRSSLMAAFFVIAGDFIVLLYTDWGILGLILVQGFVQLCYANWKWPLEVCREFSINFIGFLRIGFRESARMVRNRYA